MNDETMPEYTPAAALHTTHPHDWHEDRRRGIGGSDVWPILAGDALRIYHEKTRPHDPDEDESGTVDMLRGRLMEPVLADLWARSRGRRIRRSPQRQHRDEPWAVVNIDRLVLATDDEPTSLMEVKAPRREVYNTILDGGLRKRTACQIYHGLFVTGYEVGYYVTGNVECSPPMVTFTVERDGELVTTLAHLLKRFWSEHVVPMVPPDPEEWNILGREFTDRLPATPSTTPALDAAEIEWAAELYDRTRAIEREAKKEKAEARAVLAAAMEAAGVDEAVLGGRWKITYKRPSPRTSFDDDLLRDHRPLDFDAVVRAFRDHTTYTDSEIVMLANSCRLDVDRFVIESESGPRLTLTDLEQGG